ncbi:pupal cuticle protein [Wyeomyia smithii]|uniref:pupal cuticle protein n=1 Tax=Wyeomyia smithii TaxID=174621 RepID=UPI00246811C3|nr:pupal cuticle protein [Wyeomyia smithii]
MMRVFVLGSVLLLASSACASAYIGHEVSSQYQAHDGIGGYSYGYADPNSQKHETKDAHGVTHGGYSYVDGDGHVQTVKYTADPVHGFQVVGTNLPKAPAPVHAVAPAYGHYASPWAYAPVVLGHNGAPLETPEVQAAKAAHFAAHAEAKARLHRRSIYAGPWNHAPAEDARASHWYHHEALVKKWNGPIHIPVIHKGVPVETPEVQHAKAAHAAAYAKVHSGYAPAHEHHYQEPVHEQHHAPSYGAWHGPQHVPVIHNGVPVETPEVQHAKAAHYNALAEASAHSQHGPEDDGSYKPELWEKESY